MARSIGFEYFRPKNPDAPYFAIKIEDKIYDIDINYIENLTVTRKLDDQGDFTFTIVNYADYLLEQRFYNLFSTYTGSFPPISIRWGWALAEKSPWTQGYIYDFTPEYFAVGGGYFRFTVTGVLMPWSENLVKEYKGRRVSDIFLQLANDVGWEIHDVDTSELLTAERPYILDNVDPIDFVRKKLEPEAFTAKGHEPYKFIYSTDGGKTDVWFVSVNKGEGEVKNYNFYINMGNYGSVLGWSPSYKGYDMSAFMQEAAFDEDTNEIFVFGGKPAPGAATKLTTHGSTSPDRMAALLTNKWYQENIGQFKANLTIVGDPTLHLMQHINVCPMNNKGQVHLPSAGTYVIQQITDTLGADYRTDLELFKESRDNDNKTMPLVEAVQFLGKK